MGRRSIAALDRQPRVPEKKSLRGKLVVAIKE